MYGSDFYLDDSGDVVFTSDNDIKTENTARLIAQDLKEEASTPYGSLPWDGEAGSYLFEMINAEGIDESDIVLELERLAYRDPRIDASTVSAAPAADGTFSLSYTPLGFVTEDKLLFDLQQLFGESHE